MTYAKLRALREKATQGEWTPDAIDDCKFLNASDAALACYLVNWFDTESESVLKDAERLDYLERELELEQKYFSDGTREDRPLALFRRNVPITRAAIDAARKEQGHG